jgi:hypothetical protein
LAGRIIIWGSGIVRGRAENAASLFSARRTRAWPFVISMVEFFVPLVVMLIIVVVIVMIIGGSG